MKIAIFFGYLDKKSDANIKIAENISQQLSELGHEITLLGVSKDIYLEKAFVQPCESGAYNIYHMTENPVIRRNRARLEQYIKSQADGKNLTRKSAVLKYILTHPVSSAVIMYSYSPFYKEDVSEYSAKFINRFSSKNKIDAIISITAPAFTVSALFHKNIDNCKKIIYQLDPYGLHELYTPKEDETEWFRKADCIFTTDILHEKYSKHKDYSSYISKIHTLNFPSFVKPLVTEKTEYLDNDRTNIVFCGAIEDRYRKPEKFLQLISKVIDRNPNVCVHFFGRIISEVLKSYSEKYPDNIIVHSYIPPQYIPSLLQSADALLNIGNSLKLQLPSKIFEYFATGKPIIHQEVIQECTCRKYMQEYPLAYIIPYDDAGDDCTALSDFIFENKGKQLDWDTVNKMYKDYTPQAVAERISSIISDL